MEIASPPLINVSINSSNGWKITSKLITEHGDKQAWRYLNNQWLRLDRYFNDGKYFIDNNSKENTIRPFAIEHENRATTTNSQTSAKGGENLYSLIETDKI